MDQSFFQSINSNNVVRDSSINVLTVVLIVGERGRVDLILLLLLLLKIEHSLAVASIGNFRGTWLHLVEKVGKRRILVHVDSLLRQ